MEIGIKYRCSTIVTPENCASAIGSGGLDVFSTPSMIALMEKACYTLVQSYLKEGESTVGTHLSVDHLKGSKIGETITAEATLTAIDGRKIVFEVVAQDSLGNIIGKGIHHRFIISVDKFISKL